MAIASPGPATPGRVIRCSACPNLVTLVEHPDDPNQVLAAWFRWCPEDGWRCPWCASTRRVYPDRYPGDPS